MQRLMSVCPERVWIGWGQLDTCLVFGGDGSGVCEDGYLGIKLPRSGSFEAGVNKDHALPHCRPLHLLQSQRCGLTRHHLCNITQGAADYTLLNTRRL